MTSPEERARELVPDGDLAIEFKDEELFGREDLRRLLAEEIREAEERGRRRELPQRRAGYALKFMVNRMEYHALVNFFEDGRPAEIFLNAGKPGTDTNVAARDAAVAASLALQWGCPVEELLGALTQSPQGGPTGDLVPDGPLGIAFKELINGKREE